MVAAAAVALGGGAAALRGGGPMAALVGLSLAPLVARGGGWRALAVAALYAGGHFASGRLLALPPAPPPPTAGVVVALGGFAMLFGVQAMLQARPRGRLARALQPHLFAGLYLDELFTRLTFRLWPPRRPPSPAPTAAWHLAPTQET
jgi:NAD(P)H-quinone oxidoreductase subunit 5